MTNSYKWASDEVVLLFSLSFEDGAILTKDAFMVFLREATREELSTAHFVFLPSNEAAYLPHEFYGTLDIPGEILGSAEVH